MPRPPDPLSRNLRLRRRRFPKNRPRGAPYGYLEGVGWLARDVLWIDGWLTGNWAHGDVEVTLDLEGTPMRVRTPVLVDREIAYPAIPGSRRWILVVPADGAGETASCVRDVTLSLSCGEVLWHGGRERLIAPDLTRRLRALGRRPDLLARVDAFLSRAAETRGIDVVGDPLFERTSRQLRATWASARGPQPKGGSRAPIHVEQAVSSKGGSLLISGWMATDALERPALSVLTRSGERVPLLERVVFYSRPDLESTVEAPTGVARAFLAVVALEGNPAETRPMLCIDDPGCGVGVKTLKPRLAPVSQLAKLVEDLLEEACLEVDDETAYQLLSPVSAELAGGSNLPDPIPFGHRQADPRTTVITSFLESHDLLDHHFVHADQTDSRSREYFLLFGRDADRAGVLARLESLAELYEVSGLAFFAGGEASWGAHMEAVARRARGDVLVFWSGQVLSFGAGSVERLARTVLHKPTVGVAAPVVSYFDGRPRYVGLGTDLDGFPYPPRPAHAEPGDLPTEGSREGCAAECLAVRRSLFLDVGGFTGRYFHEELEVADLCRRVLSRRRSVTLAPVTVTRFGPDPLELQARVGPGLAMRHDVERLGRVDRHPVADDRVEESRSHNEGQNLPGDPEPPRFAELRAHQAVPLASVVIPTYNAGPEFEEVLERIEHQEVSTRFEILIVDSGSTDGTLELVRRRRVPYIDVRRGDFGHGSTRQLGAARCSGDVVVFLSQDAFPEPAWLEGLVDAFGDPSVGGSYSRQIPRKNAPPFVIDQLSRWPATSSEPRLQRLEGSTDLEDLPLETRLTALCFDNVSSAVRRSVLLKVPFRNVRFGADRDWAYRVLKAGHTIAYRPDSRVIHSHDRSAWYELKRTFCDHRALSQLFGGRTFPTAVDTLSSYRHEVLRLLDIACRGETWASRLQRQLEVPAIAFARTAGESLGIRAAVRCADGSRLWTFLSRVLQRGV